MKKQWSKNAKIEINTGIAPFYYFKNIKRAKQLFDLELLNIEKIFSGNCITQYKDDYTKDLIVRQYYNELLNEICEIYFNNNEFNMFNFFNENTNNIKSFMFHKNYKNNLVPVSYHHRIYYYVYNNEKQIVSDNIIYFYMFNFLKYFERKR